MGLLWFPPSRSQPERGAGAVHWGSLCRRSQPVAPTAPSRLSSGHIPCTVPSPGQSSAHSTSWDGCGALGPLPRASAGLWELQLGPGTCQQPFENKPKKPQHNKRQNVLFSPEISQDARPRQGRSSWALAGWALAAPAAEVLSLPAPPAARGAARERLQVMDHGWAQLFALRRRLWRGESCLLWSRMGLLHLAPLTDRYLSCPCI